jgi:hypothetical protein
VRDKAVRTFHFVVIISAAGDIPVLLTAID